MAVSCLYTEPKDGDRDLKDNTTGHKRIEDSIIDDR